SASPANYTGTISIANSDPDKNPYTFSISGYGYDGNKATQTITFNPIPVKVIGSSDFNPGASSSAGLVVSYTSSNASVATIVNGQIHIVNTGTSNITATQAGDAATNPARGVTQTLTVTPVLPPPGTNMVKNPTFDVNTSGWAFSNKNGATSIVESVPMAGSSTNVGKVTITNLGTTTSSDNVQLSTDVFLVKDRNYLITFKANADAARTIGLRILQNASPYSTIFSKTISITTTQATYGFYAYTSTYTGSVALRFFLGNSNIPTYFDDIVMIEEANSTLPVTLLSFTGTLSGDRGILSWETTSEINAKEFSIEKSSDGSTFTTIGNVQAENNINRSYYSFTDASLKSGLSFYRLRYADRDGSFKYSKVVTLKVDRFKATGMKIFPNPVSNNCSVSYPPAAVRASLLIVTTDGKKINEYAIAPGSAQRSIDVSGLSAGQYFIIYSNSEHTSTVSFIKK
ncbi:MAG: T9SS type A sorting domain-containing protein, partial [Bacteroidota bacterium]|nr:T9SS type A sorting domain-containing protein [Bacteroidota bacterium]